MYKLVSSGDNPPCIHIIFSSIIAAIGKQLKQSVNVFQSFILYLLLPGGGEVGGVPGPGWAKKKSIKKLLHSS